MTLAVIAESPHTPEAWLRWSFHHKNSHDNIRDAIFKQTQQRLFDYPVDPISAQDQSNWLQFNSQLHADMNGALGQQSSDLLEVDFDDDRQREAWIQSHYQEHWNAEMALKI